MPNVAGMKRLDLPLLLPEVDDVRDACIARLTDLLMRRRGIERAHVLETGEREEADDEAVSQPTLCLHYDTERWTLRKLETLARVAGAKVAARYAHVVLPIRDIATEDDGVRIEEALRELPGVTAASVSLAAQVARIEFDRERAEVEGITASLQRLTRRAPAAPPAKEVAVAEPGFYAKNRELVWSLTSGTLLLTGWLLQRYTATPRGAVIALLASAYVFGARDNVGHFLGDLRRGKLHFNIDLLMVVAAAGAAVLGEWAEGALLLFLFSLGHALEHYALGRARHAIAALAELAPRSVRLRRAGREEEVPIEGVRPGDEVVVRPGERIGVDGIVREGLSAVNQAPITGESIPVDKVVGDAVFAGTVNGEGALVIEVTVAVGDRTLDRVITLVSEAQTQKAPTQQFTERFARVFVPLVLIGDVLLIVVPATLGLLSWADAFARAMAVLVAASPCALALGTPAAVLAGIAQAARNGVLIKGGEYLESLGSITALALDKTGTLTVGEPEATDLVPADGVSEEILLLHAASVEQRSQHPLARAVVRAAERRAMVLRDVGDLTAVMSRGVRATVDGAVVEVGRALLFEDAGVKVPSAIQAAVEQLEAKGRSTMIVRRIGHTPEFLGVLGMADQPRENAGDTLVALRKAGIRQIVMLTGDNHGVGAAVGTAVGVDRVLAGLLPEDKVTAIKALAAEGPVAMVGDGVNDAPALAHATVGIAMGGAGTAAALETADVALMGDDLSRLPFAIGLSRQARRVIRQNLWISLGVIGGSIVVTIGGFAGIGPAVIVHEGSTLVVIANALRLLRYNAR